MKIPLPKHLRFFLVPFNRLAEGEIKETFISYILFKYSDIKEKKGRVRASSFCLWQIGQIYVSLLIENITWRISMFRNYFKIMIRNLRKQKAFSFINIFGLSMGIACCLLILSYLMFELSYDTYHPDGDRIFRIASTIKSRHGENKRAGAPCPLAPYLKENDPRVEAVARLSYSRPVVVQYGDIQFREERNRFVDTDIFRILDIPFLEGDPATALERPHTVVLTETLARRYFGTLEPVGEVLRVETDTYETSPASYEVTGIVADPPPNTHFKYGLLLSMKTIENVELINNWGGGVPTYVKLTPGTDPEGFTQSVADIGREHLEEYLRERGAEFTVRLQPVRDIHLRSNLSGELEPPGNPLYLTIFSLVCILILLIASLNFMNLSTARTLNRAAEVGLRKVVGATRRQLVGQFLGESTCIALISLVIGAGLAAMAIQLLRPFTPVRFSISDFLKPCMLVGYLGIVVFIGMIAGAYPALFLSAFKPVSVLQGSVSAGTRSGFMRKLLVVTQFTISIVLIIGTVAFYRQLHYMKNKNLGIQLDEKLVLNLQGVPVPASQTKSLKQEFEKIPGVMGSTFSSSIPGRWRYRWRLWPTGEREENNRLIKCMQVDTDFRDVFGLEMAAGRWFSKDLATNRFYNGMILNEAAVKAYGWGSPEEALEKTLMEARHPILGVVKDYHFAGLQNFIEPLSIFQINEDFVYLILAVKTEDSGRLIASVKARYQALFPGVIFEYFFLDQDFQAQYKSEERLSALFSFFTFLGIGIACLGLFGLASYMAEQKTKEIGIRKVLGASNTGILILFSREFLKWVAMANLIAWPFSYLIVKRWLLEFAYQAPVRIWIFLASGLFSIAIALLTVIWQSVRAASANPVESLHYE
jgi:putative ABC transport system permease protein